MTKGNSLLNSDDDLEFLQSLKDDFYVETLDSLEKSEAILLEFEDTHNELKKLEYKRILHSIKGSAKAVEEERFAKIVHTIEDSLSCVSTESMDFQFQFLDASHEYMKMRKQNDDSGADKQLSELETLIKAIK